jgi:hypothetical protein
MGVNYFESETSFYTTPICCPHGSPLSPRQRYIRRQSDQKDNQGFLDGGILHLTQQAGQLICFMWYFTTQ